MDALTDTLSSIFGDAFAALGFDRHYGAVALSNRPDLGQFQCNGALAAAGSREPRLNPRELAGQVLDALPRRDLFADLSLAGPGFINITLTDEALATQVQAMADDPRLGVPPSDEPRRIVLDYGGANVAKRMHVGHLRAAIIGDSLRRLFTFRGDGVIGDIHLGDWGTNMGQLITEIERRQPDLPYFDPQEEGPFPDESPVAMDDFAEIYPTASARAKNDPAVAAAARLATQELQNGRPGYQALWRHMRDVSVAALKADIARLGVHFDLWLGESDAAPFVDQMIAELKASGHAQESQGALVVDVARPDDKKEVPPLLLIKSDGAVLYGTTDLATIYLRVRELGAEAILYVVDQRQALHFEQVFRAAWQSGIAAGVDLEHLGFGTMNGPDGRPFKTRTGGVMTLNDLMDEVMDKAYSRLREMEMAAEYPDDERREIARLVGLAALKFADLINQRTKDYTFDVERFTEFEGRTGPYLLYTAVRTKSILRNAAEQGLAPGPFVSPTEPTERDLMLALTQFPDIIKLAYDSRMPNHVADYAYNLSMTFNRFYRTCHILTEEDAARQASWLGLLQFFLAVLEKSLEILGIETPERM